MYYAHGLYIQAQGIILGGGAFASSWKLFAPLGGQGDILFESGSNKYDKTNKHT